MNRKEFIFTSGKLILGSFLLPYTNFAAGPPPTPAHAALLRKAYPIVLSFLKTIVRKGVEKYATDQVADWLEDHLSSSKNTKEEIKKLPDPVINNNLIINGGQIDIFVGFDQMKQPELILIPTLQDVKTNFAKLITDHSFVPIFNPKQHLENPNFIEMAALDQLAKYYSENLNLGEHRATYLKKALIPGAYKISDSRQNFSTNQNDKSIGSSVIKTQTGWLHILYEVNDKLKATGQITYVPDDRYSRIPGRAIDFSYDFE